MQANADRELSKHQIGRDAGGRWPGSGHLFHEKSDTGRFAFFHDSVRQIGFMKR